MTAMGACSILVQFQSAQKAAWYHKGSYILVTDKHGAAAAMLLPLQALVPPSVIPQVQIWLKELGTLPPPPPRDQWGPIRTPLQAELAKDSEQTLGIKSSSTPAAAAAMQPPSSPADVPAGAATTAKSSADNKPSASVAAAAIAAGLAIAVAFV